jgi:hypothetical protein
MKRTSPFPDLTEFFGCKSFVFHVYEVLPIAYNDDNGLFFDTTEL